VDNRRLLAGFRRQFVLVSVLTWLPIGCGLAVLLLLMDSRGLELAVIGAIVFAYGLSSALLELPTGGLADVLSRRGVLAVAAGVGVVAFAWGAVAVAAWEFTVVYLLFGLMRALQSGPAEAWYVDAVHAVDADGDIRGGLAAAHAAGAVSLGVGTVGGGALALFLPLPESAVVTGLSAPLLLSALLNLVLLGAVSGALREPGRPARRLPVGRVLAAVPATVVAGVRVGLRDRVLSRLLVALVPVGVGLTAVELLTPGRLLSLTGDARASASAYGVIAAVGFAASALGSMASGLLVRLVRGRAARATVVGTIVAALGLAVLFATGFVTGMAGVLVTAVGYALMFFGIGLRGPVQAALIHGHVGAAERATVLSIQSLLMRGGGSLGALVLPLLVAVWSVPAVWLAVGVLLAVSAALFVGTGSVVRHGPAVPEAATAAR
jgi:MFS family permease